MLKKRKIETIQDWLPFETILENGIIKLKDQSYVKIIKVIPLNYHLKSNLEKEAILNSYKIFLQTCEFNIQILIQSNKENLSKNIANIKNANRIEENKEIILLSNQYIQFIQDKNLENKSSSKKFFILIKEFQENKNQEEIEKININNLNTQYFKIKECLYRCGNGTYEISSKKELEDILYSFFNYHNFLLKGSEKNNI